MYSNLFALSRTVKNPKIRSFNLHLCLMTFKFDVVRAVFKVRVYANLHQAKCSGSRVNNSKLDFGQL